MHVYILRRLLAGIVVVLGVVSVVFFSLHLIPGDPITALIPPEMTGKAAEELAEQLRARHGLDQPVPLQYVMYMKRVLTLDFGESIRTRRSIAEDLLLRYPATAELALASLVFAGILGVVAGVLSAVHKNSWLDGTSMTLALMGVSVPNFWLGLLLMLVFSLGLGWLPPSGRVGGVGSWEAVRYLLMPAVTLGTAAAGILARLVRSAVIDVLGEDYIRTARAKGLSERVVIYRHALKNALIPVVTEIGLQFGVLLSGAVVVESVFAWPGLGRFLIIAITGKDFPVVQAGVMLVAVTFVLINLLVDLLYAFLDPRITYG